VDLFLTGNAVRILPAGLFGDFFWSESAVAPLGIDPARLPPFVETGEVIGSVRARAAETLGIPAGLPVVAGGCDFVMSILGTAATEPGRVCGRSGTTEAVNLCSASPVRSQKLLCFPHVVRGAYNVSAMLASAGTALDWAARSIGDRSADGDALVAGVQSVPAGAGRLLFLPFLRPGRFPVWSPDMRGAFVGLTPEHGRREMTRAVVESGGFAVRSILEEMRAAGCPLVDLRVSGGPARSPLWCQIRADMTGLKVLVPEVEDAELVGAACAGFLGLEQFDSLAAASAELVRFTRTFAPEPGPAAVYTEMAGLFARACESLGGLFS
jgi:xylulokinase